LKTSRRICHALRLMLRAQPRPGNFKLGRNRKSGFVLIANLILILIR
jgi:hypothetical protein